MNHSPQATVILKPDREKPVRQGHPWIFSGAIQRLPDQAQDGDIVAVCDAPWRMVGPRLSQSRQPDPGASAQLGSKEIIDEDFWRRKIEPVDRSLAMN